MTPNYGNATSTTNEQSANDATETRNLAGLFKSGSAHVKTKAEPRRRAQAKLWPTLEQLAMPSETKIFRSRGIGGSDANIILSGNSERLIDLWRQKRGEQAPPDLSDKLQVALGTWKETFRLIDIGLIKSQGRKFRVSANR
jgi:hypothetical protein